jgi:large subunit ribosomal protein L1
MPRSKRYQELAKKIDADKLYTPEEAIKLTKETASTKFDSAVEVHVKLGIDPKRGEQQVRGTVVLPHGIGKSKSILVFAEGDKAKEAQDAGADAVGGQEMIDEIKKTGKCDFDLTVATPDMMKNLAPIARVLGPRGIMPSPKNETITTNLKKTIDELKKGKIAFKNDDTANLHQIIGKASFDEQKILENYRALIDTIEKSKPEGAKGTFLKSITLTTTMGPGIKVATK